MNLNLPTGKLIDISLPLDASTFHMRTYSGFRKDMQFEVEVIKAYEDGGYGQIVRGAHMRLHAGTHVDAPSHMIKGAPDLQDVPLHPFRRRDHRRRPPSWGRGGDHAAGPRAGRGRHHPPG